MLGADRVAIAKNIALAHADRAGQGAAELDGGGDQRIEHRLQIERRAADDLEHVGGRGLHLQRLGEVARARLHLVEQPHVFDRDDGLVGEGRDQLDLALRERNRRGAAQSERANQLAVAHERHAEHGPHPANAHLFLFRIFRVAPGIGYLDGPFLRSDTPDERPSAGPDLGLPFVLEVGGVEIHQARCIAEDVSMATEDFAAARVAQTHRGRDQRLQHRVEIEGCPADGFEHFGGRRLLLQRLGEVARARLHLVEQPHVLDRDNRLVGEGL